MLKREYRHFLANRVSRIESDPNVLRHHFPIAHNPADLGGSGGSVSGAEIWWQGPSWIEDPAQWPPEIVNQPSPKSRAERKVQKELFAAGVQGRNQFDVLLEKFGLRKAMVVQANWCLDFAFLTQLSLSFR